MKFKNLTKEQIIISLDRLTRIKYTKEKYLRVFSDILSLSLIEPKLRKNDILHLDLSKITQIVSEIINASLKNILGHDYIEFDSRINEILAENELHMYNIDTETKKLLENTINYNSAIILLENESKVNLKWLKSLANNNNTVDQRQKEELKYPLKKIVLVEGITEEILLPAFAKILKFSFDAEGIHLIPAGGKNQVVKMYYKLAEDFKLPIFILLDKDAEENIIQITPKLRSADRIHLVSCGEFEDLLPRELILRTVNNHFNNFLKIEYADLKTEASTVSILEAIFAQKGLHEFKKAEFAKLIRENVFDKNDLSTEVCEILNEIFTELLDTQACSC